jgi:hypothetical protein
MAVTAKTLVGQDQQLLIEVLSTAQGDPNKVLNAVQNVLKRVPRIRHSYLSHVLIACAHAKLQNAKSRDEQYVSLSEDPDVIQGARLHEAEITYGLSDD